MAELKEIKQNLLRNGYKEAKNKKNLFYKKNELGCFFADIRGTSMVPIWQDSRPLLYYSFKKKGLNWKKRRLVKQELKNLFKKGCVCRLSYEFPLENEEFEGTEVAFHEDDGWYVWDDGYCWYCGKDFQDEGSFCSTECEEKFEEGLKEACPVCNEKMDFLTGIKHHISYFPEKIVFVHVACHNKIHKTNLYPYLQPNAEEIKAFYQKKRQNNLYASP